MKQLKFILSGGGTGGHIYPAVAIANELKVRYPDCDILFVGASDKMEMQKIPQAGYPIRGLWIAGIQRKITLDNLLFPLKLASSMLKARSIISSFKPDAVIGTGGFASGPVLKVAASMGIPTLLQEQNSYPGITNKWLSKQASKICVAYDNLQRFFPAEKIVMTGNPVRQDLIDVSLKKQEGRAYYNISEGKKVLLVLGGSLGSRRINQLIAKELLHFAAHGVELIWQCGKMYYPEYSHFSENKDIRVVSFIERMDLAYAAADFVISRSGASSVSELCLAGKPVIFIPSPNVAEDHQTKNARAIVDKGGALMLRESELDSQFATVFNNLLEDEELQKSLSAEIMKMARVNATRDIVDEIEKLILKDTASGSSKQ